jgi:hypothetical protein
MNRTICCAAYAPVALFLWPWLALSQGPVRPEAKANDVAVAEPEFEDVFFRLDAGKLTPLERQSINYKGHAGFMGHDMQSSSEFSGEKSPIRFKASDHLQFIVKPSLNKDPESIFYLRRLTPKKKLREMVLMTGSVKVFGGTTQINPTGSLPVQFSRYGGSSLIMTMTALPPGEYAVGPIYGNVAFCFGVD